ncbi:MAG: hypothetical protein ACKOPG_10465 [Novosphingobium sp.]
MPERSNKDALLCQIGAALAANDGSTICRLACELAAVGSSQVARTNRTNKKKAAETARSGWTEKTGVDPVKFFALAALLHNTATNRDRKWRISVECALMVLRPDLGHRRGIFRPGAKVPQRVARGGNSVRQAEMDRERDAIVRKLGSALAYQEGPLEPLFAEVAASWTASQSPVA